MRLANRARGVWLGKVLNLNETGWLSDSDFANKDSVTAATVQNDAETTTFERVTDRTFKGIIPIQNRDFNIINPALQFAGRVG